MPSKQIEMRKSLHNLRRYSAAKYTGLLIIIVVRVIQTKLSSHTSHLTSRNAYQIKHFQYVGGNCNWQNDVAVTPMCWQMNENDRSGDDDSWTRAVERRSEGKNDLRRRRYSSPGEELVYREMMEHQMRETELHQHWKQVHFFLPHNTDFLHLIGGDDPQWLPNSKPLVLALWHKNWKHPHRQKNSVLNSILLFNFKQLLCCLSPLYTQNMFCSHISINIS